MAKSFTEFSVKERLDLLYRLLTFIKTHPKLTVKEIRERFAKNNDLTEYASDVVTRILDLSDFIDVVYKGFPARPYYELTPEGEKIILRGRFTVADFKLEWARRRIVRKIRVKVRVLRIQVKNFVFEMNENWGYKIKVITPIEWKHGWQVDIWGKEYSVKHRAIILLQTLEIARNYFAGYRFVNYRELGDLGEELMKRHLEQGRELVVWRTMKFDPEDRITVTRLGQLNDRLEWEVDFSNFSHSLPETLDLDLLEDLASSKNYSVL